MSKKTIKPDVKTDSTRRLSYYPALTHTQARDKFVESMELKDDGSNIKSHLADFLAVAERLLSVYKSFTFSDAITASARFEIPAHVLRDLFSRWTEKLESLDKLTRIPNSCYDESVWQVIG